MPKKSQRVLIKPMENYSDIVIHIFVYRQKYWKAAFSGVRVTRSLVLYVCFVKGCLSFCPFSFGHYGFLLPLGYFQALLQAAQHELQP